MDLVVANADVTQVAKPGSPSTAHSATSSRSRRTMCDTTGGVSCGPQRPLVGKTL